MIESIIAELPPPARPCLVTVVIPARNEALAIGRALAALAAQRPLVGEPLRPDCFDVIVFANNCTDGTNAVVRRCAAALADRLRIHLIERDIRAAAAHVGNARRIVMDAAAARFLAVGKGAAIVASTDADTIVDERWIAWTLHEARGADAVAGDVALADAERAQLVAPVRLLYARERTYHRLVAALEHAIDPRPEDPAPRHRSFVGASFAVRVRTYVAAGGLPPLPRLEDLQFSVALERIDARVRHSTRVRASTSGRTGARVNGGFGSFIGELHACAERGESFTVTHPQATLAALVRRAALRRLWPAIRRSPLARSIPFGAAFDRLCAAFPLPDYPDVTVDVAIDLLRAALTRHAPLLAGPSSGGSVAGSSVAAPMRCTAASGAG